MLPQLAALLYPVQAHNHSDVWNIIGYWRVLMQPSFGNDSNLSPFTLLSVNKNKVLLKSGDQDYSVGYQIDANNHTINLTLDDKTWLFHVSHQYNHITWLSCETTTYTLWHGYRLPQRDECKPDAQLTHTGNGSITAQMPGRVTKIAVKTGDTVQKGDVLIVIESMKMENNILSPSGAVVGEIFVNTGDLVNTTMPLLHLDTQ
jgi:acetyl/propionyl-CoA carboxylase alpha subunit